MFKDFNEIQKTAVVIEKEVRKEINQSVIIDKIANPCKDSIGKIEVFFILRLYYLYNYISVIISYKMY